MSDGLHADELFLDDSIEIGESVCSMPIFQYFFPRARTLKASIEQTDLARILVRENPRQPTKNFQDDETD